MLFTVAANLSDPKHIVMISTLKKQQRNGKGAVWNGRREEKRKYVNGKTRRTGI